MEGGGFAAARPSIVKKQWRNHWWGGRGAWAPHKVYMPPRLPPQIKFTWTKLNIKWLNSNQLVNSSTRWWDSNTPSEMQAQRMNRNEGNRLRGRVEGVNRWGWSIRSENSNTTLEILHSVKQTLNLASHPSVKWSSCHSDISFMKMSRQLSSCTARVSCRVRRYPLHSKCYVGLEC